MDKQGGAECQFTGNRSISLVETGQDDREHGTRHGCLHNQNMIECRRQGIVCNEDKDGKSAIRRRAASGMRQCVCRPSVFIKQKTGTNEQQPKWNGAVPESSKFPYNKEVSGALSRLN